MTEPTAMEMDGQEATIAPQPPGAPAAPAPAAESKHADEKAQEPAAAVPEAPVHPSMVLAMQRRCEAARLRLQELRERCLELESSEPRAHTCRARETAATHSIDRMALVLCSATSHRALTQPSGVAAEPCPCIAGMHTILDTKIAIATRAEPETTRASASASSTAPLVSSSSPSPRFDVSGLRVDALQTFLTRDGPSLEQWRVSVQLTNTTQRRFEQLQLDVLEEPAAISRLSTQCRIASLGPGQSVCLALQLHVPEDRPALSLSLSLSWFESKHWTSSHHIAAVTLPPWAAQGQHTSVQHPNATQANEPINAPMLSLLDCAHFVNLTISTDEPAAAVSMADATDASAAASSSAVFNLQSMLQNQFGFESPPPSGAAACMLAWLRSSRSSLSSLGASSFLLHPAAPRLIACVTGDRSFVVFAAASSHIMRFAHAMQTQLQTPMRVAVGEAESEAQRAGERLLAAMVRENEGQASALQRSFPMAFAHDSNGPRSAGSSSGPLPAMMQYLRSTMPLQEATNHAAEEVVALLK